MKNGLTNPEIVNKTNISYTIINNIRNKKTFQHLTKNEDIPIIKCKNQYK